MNETCPKCGSTKVENDECLQCGIYLSKYRAHLLRKAGGASGAPPVAPEGGGLTEPMQEIGYKILGGDIQFVEVELEPGRAAVAEPGAMLYLEADVTMEAVAGGILSAGARLLSGESLFLTIFTNGSGQKRRVAFAAPFPGKIFAIRLSEVGGELLAQRGVFLAGGKGVNITIAFQKKLGAGLLGGAGFILQSLQGEGMVFVAGAGAVAERRLEPGEKLRVQSGAIVAFEKTVSYDIEYVGSIKSVLFGGQGLVFAALTGPGRIWLQSPALMHFARSMVPAAAESGTVAHAAASTGVGLLGNLLGGGGQDEGAGEERTSGGSILDGLGTLFGGGSDKNSDS